jgi:uncharacterized protein YuzE
LRGQGTNNWVSGIREAGTGLKITYDLEVDVLYIRFIESTVTAKHFAEGIAADYDAEGRLAGIEILDVVKRFGGRKVFRQVVLEDVALTSA